MIEKLRRASAVLVAVVCIPVGFLMAADALKHPGPKQKKDLAGAASVVGFGLFGWFAYRQGKVGIAQSAAPCLLDVALMHWTPDDAFSVRDLLNGGICILGRAGSGKTSGSGMQLARGLVQNRNIGGLILAAKPNEDLRMWQEIFEREGRKDALLVFSPEHRLRFNYLDYEMKHGGHTRNITKTIMVIGETLRGADSKGGEDGDFWETSKERLIFNAVEIVKLGTGTVSAPDLQRFITGAAYSAAQLSSEEWRKGFHNQMLKAAFERKKSAIEKHDFELAKDYWMSEFPNMADKTRSSILAGVMNTLHVANTGIIRELFSTTTNVTPDDALQGKWIFCDMAPPSELGDVGSFACAVWKYMNQRAVLRRTPDENSPINITWADEAHLFVNSFDSPYLAMSRSRRGASVYLTQSLPSFYSILKGEGGKAQTDALLGNFTTRVYHACSDFSTAKGASELIGRSLQVFVGGSMSRQKDAFDAVFGQSGYQANMNEHYEDTLQSCLMMNGLRTGGPPDYTVDGIVIRSGRPFSTGQNFLKVSFDQRA